MLDNFLCASMSPVQFDHCGIALATIRAGGVGLLDSEFCTARQMPRAVENVRQLLNNIPAADQSGIVGLRLATAQLVSHGELLELCAGRQHWVVLSGWSPQELDRVLEKLSLDRRQIWLETRAADQVSMIDAELPIAGWIARGAECGGHAGRESAFVLCQHLAEQNRPFLVQGVIGPHAAAACRVAGAAGVVLDDSLLLMRESGLPADWRHQFERLGVADTRCIDGAWADSCRIVYRPDFAASLEMMRRAEHIGADLPENARQAAWQEAIDELVGWDDPDKRAWPLGESAGWASELAQQYGSTGRLVQAVLKSSMQHIQTAAQQAALAPDAPLARSQGTRYPIVQGPMTRVSDRVSFAAAVAKDGALPLLALGLMRGPEVEKLLTAGQQELAGSAWGIGILGFVPPQLQQEQLAVVKTIRPPFALIAGGRPDQALQLEENGIATYVHVPLQLLRQFAKQGVRRFVFEGAECGGHVGPLHSLSLWEGVIDTLLSEIPVAESQAVHVLFAGGIHDSRSAAMVAAMSAPLSERGMKVGVLMGTAYLFTDEAVGNTAITSTFQRQALECQRTVTIATGPGHAIRCAPTQFTETFEQMRLEIQRSGRSRADASNALEQLLTGRSRIASKGLLRQGDHTQSVDEEQQLAEGMYMMGEVAALRRQCITIADLHEEVSASAIRLLGSAASATPHLDSAPKRLGANRESAQVAIIGVGCLLPGAQDLDTLWRNLLEKNEYISEIPADRWDWRLLYDADPGARDRIYSKWGGFIDPLQFNPSRFGIPPNSLASISLPQLLALEVTRRALQDANYGEGIQDERLRERTAVIFGTANTGEIEQLYMARSALPLCVPALDENVWQRLPEWTEESYVGILANVVAGRIANRFDLGGPNLTVDAACASSFAALDLAFHELEQGRSDLVIAGGIEFDQTPQAYMAFSKTRAFSARGRASVFDTSADGIVISEGAVVLLLKRLTDAERDGDRILSVIRSVAGSSDGKGYGLTAPKSAGQRRAVVRAHELAGIDSSTLGLYEAHGTGTVVGDAVELETISGVLREAGAPARHCAIGSAKPLLGHTRSCAGMVGLLKAALALRHRVLPPHAGVDEPLAPFRDADCPVYLLDEPSPWLADDAAPRRAGISAFGFGGTNYHIVLEEYDDGITASGPHGSTDWPRELFLFASTDQTSLLDNLDRLDRAAAQLEDAANNFNDDKTIRLADLAYTCAVAADAAASERIAITAATPGELRRAIVAVKDGLENRTELPSGVHIGTVASPGALAFLFPGQGAQYPGMGRELSLYFREMQRALEQADSLLTDLPTQLSHVIYPRDSVSNQDNRKHQQRLAETRFAQPAIGTISCGMLDLARRLGLQPARVSGHSYGEFVALHAAGVMGRQELLELSMIRGQLLADLGQNSGAMAAVALPAREVEAYLEEFPQIAIANINGPRQVVLAGPSQPLNSLLERLKADGHSVHPLSVSAAFHSELMRPAREDFAQFLAGQIRLRPPTIPVHSNIDGAPYPQDGEAILNRMIDHLVQRVDFVTQIDNMYDAGVRVFLELGPGRVLTQLVGRILGEREHLAIAVDGGLENWLDALARLHVHGVPMDAAALFRGRPVRWVELDHLSQRQRESADWMIDGGRVWRKDEPRRDHGSLPYLKRNSTGSNAVVSGESAAVNHTGGFLASSAPSFETEFFSGDDLSIPAAGATPAERIYLAYAETMRQFLSQQERIVSKVLEQTGDHYGSPESTAAPTEPALMELLPEDKTNDQRALGPETPAVTLDRPELTKLLIRLVCQRTGYRPEELDLHQDLEAELGVDSIKRIEILTELLGALPADIGDWARGQLEELSRFRSLDNLVELLMVRIEATPSTVDAIPAVHRNALVEAGCPRFIVRSAETKNPGPHRENVKGLYLVTEDDLGVAPIVLETLHELGANACLIQRSQLQDSDTLDQQVKVLRQTYGAVAGIVHLTPLATGIKDDDLPAWRQTTELVTKRFFRILQLCASDFGDPTCQSQVVAVSRMGGNWGRGGAFPGSPAGGGNHGILRTLESEYPRVLSKFVDFDDTLSPEEMSQRIIDELRSRRDHYEIGYAKGRRLTFSAALSPHAASATERDWRPQNGWVVLATGAARGITADVCRELVCPGVRLIVVGRGSELSGDSLDSEHEISALRQQLLDRSRERRRGTDIAPTRADIQEIESEIQKRRAASERQRHLEALRNTGAEVEYHAVDVRDEAAFGKLIDDIYRRFGRLDAVLHGAGIIDDEWIENKSSESFDRVYDTKADSALILGRHLRPESLKWIAFFSSVSGRFGNQGQADYAAANEVVNRLAWQMHARWPSTRVVSINWGPWRGGGMANEAIQGLLENRGIVAINPSDGRNFFFEELAHGGLDDVEVIAGDGPWRNGSGVG